MASSALEIDEMVDGCLAVRVRLLSRAVTAIYERAIDTSGVTVAQLNLLATAAKIGPCSQSKLGAVLQLERSTVSRNLDRLLACNWIRAVSSDDKGVREVAITSAGRRKVESVMPQWREAQKQAAMFLGPSATKSIRDVVDTMWQLPRSKSTAQLKA